MYLTAEDETQLLTAHAALLRCCAARFARRGIEYADLIQEASIALLLAARRYDPRINGRRLDVYAAACIRNRLINYCQSEARRPAAVDPSRLQTLPFQGSDPSDFWESFRVVSDSLDPQERAIFGGWIGGAKVPALQRRHGLSRQAVTWTLSRALTLLRDQLGDEPRPEPVRVNRRVLAAVS